MSEFVYYIVTVAVTIFSILSISISEPVALYMAYGFCLVAVLVVLAILLSLIPKLFLWVYNLFKRGV